MEDKLCARPSILSHATCYSIILGQLCEIKVSSVKSNVSAILTGHDLAVDLECDGSLDEEDVPPRRRALPGQVRNLF